MLKGLTLSLVIISILLSCKTQPSVSHSTRKKLITGRYYAIYRGYTFDFTVRKDSSFKYYMRWEWPLELTEGRWKMKGNKLLLYSNPDTSYRGGKISLGPYVTFDGKQFRLPFGTTVEWVPGKYIMFNGKTLRWANHKIISAGKPKLKFRLQPHQEPRDQ